MAERARLRCAALNVTLRLPFWPQEQTHVLSGWNVASLERSGRASYDRPSTRTTEERTLGFVLRNEDYRASIAPMLADLVAITASAAPVQLLLGDTDTGLWRLDPPPQITVTASADDGSASVADVSLTLRRASDAVVNVGPVKRVKGGGKGFGKKKG